MSKKFREVIADRLIVKPAEQDEMSSGGIIIPDLENQRTLKAEVIAVGEGRWEGGILVRPKTKVGDTVLYAKFSAMVIEVDGEEYHTMRETDIIAILN
jgi:chaperonin GroES